MVEHRDNYSTSNKSSKKIKRRAVSPPVLPPRWGEGVAPPTTPQYLTRQNTPETSPEWRVPAVSHHTAVIPPTTSHNTVGSSQSKVY